MLAISSSSNADQPAVPGALNAESGDGLGLPGSNAAMKAFLEGLQLQTEQMYAQIQWEQQTRISWSEIERQQFEEMQAHVQQLIFDSYQLRSTIFQTPIPNVSPDVLVKRHRDWVHEELIGRLSEPRVPLNPRSRLVLRTEQYVGYEIAIDVYDDLIASGILLLPRMQPGERRPVVVCQHGLEGTPMDTISREPDAYRIYKAFAEELVRKGFIVYCPQNPYRGGDRFRVLQRMSNPLGRTLFTYIIAQHQQTLDWLVSNPQLILSELHFMGFRMAGRRQCEYPRLLENIRRSSVRVISPTGHAQ